MCQIFLFICLCYTGIDNCAGSPCGSNGQCNDGIDTFMCNCNHDYHGVPCTKIRMLSDINTHTHYESIQYSFGYSQAYTCTYITAILLLKQFLLYKISYII